MLYLHIFIYCSYALLNICFLVIFFCEKKLLNFVHFKELSLKSDVWKLVRLNNYFISLKIIKTEILYFIKYTYYFLFSSFLDICLTPIANTDEIKQPTIIGVLNIMLKSGVGR